MDSTQIPALLTFMEVLDTTLTLPRMNSDFSVAVCCAIQFLTPKIFVCVFLSSTSTRVLEQRALDRPWHRLDPVWKNSAQHRSLNAMVGAPVIIMPIHTVSGWQL